DVGDASFPHGAAIFDLGSGGGLPGVPLKIARPDLEITLCDSIGKKIAAVKDIIERLNLTGIKAIVGRAEDIAKKPEYRNQYEVIVSRAVAPLDELIVWSKDLRKPGAIMYALKGGNLMEEIERAKKLNGVME